MPDTPAKGPGRGWHGDGPGHAAAGRRGGQVSRGNFKYNRARARAAGRKGGAKSKLVTPDL